jgi:hypothetical protein
MTTNARAEVSSDNELITPAQVCRELARPNGKPLHVSTFYRWALRGVRGERLRVVAVGGSLRTTRAWLREFGTRVAETRGLLTTSQAGD